MNVPRLALERKTLVLTLLALALLWSLSSALSMQRREDPGTTQRQTEVVTLWPGATTHNVEQLVTKKIADALRGVGHVEHVNAVSRPGISDISVVFDDEIEHADPVLRDVRHKLDDLRGTLPVGVQGPSVVDDVWKTYPMVLGITADQYSPRQLRDFARVLADRLAALPDVGAVHLVGVQRQQVNVALDLRRLSAFGVSGTQVVDALAARNALVPEGDLSLAGRRVALDGDEPMRSAADVAATMVTDAGGRIVRVGDLARVQTGYPDPPQELVRVDGRPAVALAVEAKETSSVTTMGPEVHRFLARERLTRPAGISVVEIADQPQTVRVRIDDFMFDLLLAIVIITGLVGAFMGVRNGILVTLTVVLTIALTFGAMRLLSVDLNQISLLALIISLGIVVDAGVVAIDNIERLLRAGVERKEAAWRGVAELWQPLLTSTLVAISSFLPFRLMGGAIGDFVRDLAVVTACALTMSLVVTYAVTPIIGEWFALPSRGGAGSLERLQRGYVPLARASLQRPWFVAVIAAATVLGAVLWIPRLGVQFFPSADRNQFLVDVNAPDGTEIRATERLVEHVEAMLAHTAGVTTYSAFIGRGAPRFYYNVPSQQPKPSYAQIIVDTRNIADADWAVEALSSRVQREVAGARIEVERLEQGPPVGAPIQIRLRALDAAALPAVAARTVALLRAAPGAVHVRDSLGEPTTRFVVQIDRARASAAGIDDAQVQSTLALAYGGVAATALREADRQTPVVVRLPASLRQDAAALAGIAVRSAAGGTVPLGEVARIVPEGEVSETTLRDGLPTVTVSAQAEGRLPSAVLADFKRAAAKLTLPTGVQLSYAGEDEQTTKAFSNLFLAMAIGLLVNQSVLLWEFRRLRISLVVLAAVPLGLVGAVTGLAITHNHFGFVAALGIAGLGGIVTNHAIVLFEYAKREMEHGLAMDEALIAAGSKRLRPILLTVIASVAGLLPLAFSSQTLWRPFCWALIFGLCGSMAMTLVAIPAIYRLAVGNVPRQSDPRVSETAASRVFPRRVIPARE